MPILPVYHSKFVNNSNSVLRGNEKVNNQVACWGISAGYASFEKQIVACNFFENYELVEKSCTSEFLDICAITEKKLAL
jgi:hypothetical protein